MVCNNLTEYFFLIKLFHKLFKKIPGSMTASRTKIEISEPEYLNIKNKVLSKYSNKYIN